mgnify:CR=1 FL=1
MTLKFATFEIMVAGRYLRARRREGFISVIAWFSLIGIALGVATLIIVLSVMNGFRQELLDRILGMNGHITVQSTENREGISKYLEIVSQFEQAHGVKRVIPIIEGQVMATANGKARGAIVRGISKKELSNYQIISDNIVSGALDRFQDEAGMVLGERLAQALQVNVGDSVTLLSPKGRSTALGTVPRSRAYPILALFNVGMFEYDSSIAFMSIDQAQLYFMLPGKVSKLKIFVDDPDEVTRVKQDLRGLIQDQIGVVTWKQSHSHFFNALQVERNVMFLILTLIILVAAFNIISSLIMLVTDKTKSIAIMRTIGATRGTIMRIFFLTGSAVGVIGTLMGVALGLGFAKNIDAIRRALERLSGTELWSPEIRFLSELPAIVDMGEVTTVIVMSLGLTLVATIYPSWRAARVDPVEALRYE